MTYLKRQNIGKFWPIPRKGTKYLAVASHNQNESIPLLVVMRDVLKLVASKKELEMLVHQNMVKINGKEIREVNYPLCLFDILTLSNLKNSYRTKLSEHKKFEFEQIEGKEAETKIYKVLSKKIISGNKTQLNLIQGKNILSNEKVAIGDSIVFNLKENKIEKVIPMEKGRTVIAMNGKHIGVKGKIENILERGGKKIAKIAIENSKINVWVKNLIVIE